MDVNWVTQFLSEKLCSPPEPSGDIRKGKQWPSNKYQLHFLPRRAHSHADAHARLLLFSWRWSPDLGILGIRPQDFKTSIRCVLPGTNEAPVLQQSPRPPPHQLSCILSLPALAMDSGEFLLEDFFFFLLKHTHSTPHKGCRKVWS